MSDIAEVEVEPKPREVYYRWSAAVDKNKIYFHCAEYPVVKRNSKTVVIDDYGRKRTILNTSIKKWAAPTKQEAWENYKARSRQYLQHTQNNLEKIRRAQASPLFQAKEFPVNPFDNTTQTPELL